MRQPIEAKLSGSFEAKLEALFAEAMESAFKAALQSTVAAAVEARGKEPIVPDAWYKLRQAAPLVNVDYDTLLSASKNGFLSAIDGAGGLQVTGRELHRWRAAGGHTGRNKGTIAKRKREAALAAKPAKKAGKKSAKK